MITPHAAGPSDSGGEGASRGHALPDCLWTGDGSYVQRKANKSDGKRGLNNIFFPVGCRLFPVFCPRSQQSEEISQEDKGHRKYHGFLISRRDLLAPPPRAQTDKSPLCCELMSKCTEQGPAKAHLRTSERAGIHFQLPRRLQQAGLEPTTQQAPTRATASATAHK